MTVSETSQQVSTLPIAFRLARRELRGGLRGFRIFLACLLLGVATIAAVGSLSTAMLTGLERDGRSLLGGEVEVTLTHREATAAEFEWLQENSARLSRTADLRAMARPRESDAGRRLIELKGVDQAYPLYGAVETDLDGSLQEALAERDGLWGAVVAPSLMTRLDLAVGKRLQIGQVDFEVRGVITREPDRAARAFALGERVMVAYDSLAETGLLQPGSLSYHQYRLDLPEGVSAEAWRARMNEALPEAGWQVRDLTNASPELARLIDRVGLFMTLVGLTALLVGGVGVANAVKAYLDSKRKTIATLKCVGAPARLVFQTYLIQVLALALCALAAGLVLGVLVPVGVAPVLAERLNFSIPVSLYPGPLLLAAGFGLLVTLTFTLWPLAAAQEVPPAALFREALANEGRARASGKALLAVAAAAAALAALAIFTAESPRFAVGFVIGAALALAVFRLAALAIIHGARRLPPIRRPGLRLAIANLHRPGAPTGSVVMSLGLGLTVLVAIALVESNLSRQIGQELPEEAPGFYFIDIQPDQIEAFHALAASQPGVEEVASGPMLRGRISRVNGQRPQEIEVPEEVQWVFQGDRGLTWAAAPPEGTRLVQGEWWPEDYDGPPLVSLYEEVGRALGLGPGDHLSVNILGREVEVEIANLREIDWGDLSINFVMIFSPGLLESAPQSYIATVRVEEAQEGPLERSVTEAFPNVSAIRVKEALEQVAGIFRNVALAVRATAGVTILAGILVLAGAVAAGHRRRVYDAVVLKVLGGTRARIAGAFLLEYGLLGLVTALLAAAIGTLAAYLVLSQVMLLDFRFEAVVVAATVIGATLITLAFGLVGTWRAMAQKAAPLLRNE